MIFISLILECKTNYHYLTDIKAIMFQTEIFATLTIVSLFNKT